MDKAQARELIRVIFQNPFQRDKYEHFLRNLLNQIEPRDVHYTGNLIPDAFKEHVSQYWRIGKYIDPEGVELDLLAVEVRSFSKLDRARTALRNFAVNRLKQFEKDCSLVAFYAKDDQGADWRFSFIKIEHEAWRDEKGKVRVKAELTPAKRYSYLVGEHENSHTAQNQLLDLLMMDYANPKLSEIETAFSIEKVTAEFFDQYKGLFLRLSEYLKGQPVFQSGSAEENLQAVARFAKKLLGQIVFLYFLQKKGWLGLARDAKWGTGDKRFLRRLLEQARENERNFYGSYLRYLFYEALAQERREQDDPTFYRRFDCRIPFLNGGLFEADYDWRNIPLEIPNELFSNNEKNKAGDVGTGILDVFDRYNFTIKEDEPLEREVAVDPEMLGKVFENMLEVFERKSKGAYYTPREIVHYMCRESLIHYLDSVLNNYTPTYQEYGSQQTSLFGNRFKKGQLKLTKELQEIKVPKADLDLLVRKGHLALENDQRVLDKGKETDTYRFQLPEAVRSNARLIDEKLASIRVCDPAIGSGAFPVGLLHEIVNARLALAPHSGNALTPYELKRHTIRESLYGVDIDASAIDIARLRLWLSLIVDEDDYSTIEALPNLDYKIMRGDSLIGFPENWQSPSFDKIEALKEQFFNETDQQRKAALKEQIDVEIQARMDSSKKTFGYPVNFDFRLFFSEVWREKGGFDIVIGNPPYVRQERLTGLKSSLKVCCPETYRGTADLYVFFFERGYQLLHRSGVIAYITSNKWFRVSYGAQLRSYIKNKATIIQLIDFGDTHVFDVSAYPSIIIASKTIPTRATTFPVLDWMKCDRYNSLESIYELAKANSIKVIQSRLDRHRWQFMSNEVSVIFDRMYSSKMYLHEYIRSRIWRGVTTGLNEAFVIDSKTRNDILSMDHKAGSIIKSYFRGKDLQRWVSKKSDNYLIFARRGINIDEFPSVRDHLVRFKEQLTPGIKHGRKKGDYKWFEIQDNTAYWQEFEKPKIVSTKVTRLPTFSLDLSGGYLANTCYLFTAKANAYFILGLLNSTVSHFYAKFVFVEKQNGYYEVQPDSLMQFPIPTANQAAIDSLSKVVCLLCHLSVKSFNSPLMVSYFESLVDGLVYELYFPDDIKKADKEILKHLGELKPITDGMSDEEKLAVIQSEFDRLYDPKHPVRNHLETLDSVEVVRTIREALKK